VLNSDCKEAHWGPQGGAGSVSSKRQTNNKWPVPSKEAAPNDDDAQKLRAVGAVLFFLIFSEIGKREIIGLRILMSRFFSQEFLTTHAAIVQT
jgi:hypothetical protein